MIIDKVAPYWTAEDQDRKNEIERQKGEIEEELDKVENLLVKSRTRKDTDETILEDVDRLNVSFLEGLDLLKKVQDEQLELENEVEARYIKGNSKKKIISDIEEIVSAIEKEDFLDAIKQRQKLVIELANQGKSPDAIAILRKYSIENYENCCDFILYLLKSQFNALADDENSIDKAVDIVKKRVALWYVNPSPAYLAMAHGKATDALAFMSTKNAKIDRITGTTIIEKFGVQLAVLNLQELKASLGINTDKLLSTAVATFTQQNDFRHTKNQPPKRDIAIPLREYAKRCGYDLEEHETSTPEEAEKEKRRAKNQLDNFRKAVKKDLDILQSSTLTWEEPIRQTVRNFDRISLVSRTKLENGYIRIWFTPEIASYLAERKLITKYPTKLLLIDARQPNAYYIGRKLAEHYNIDENKIHGTHDKISIPKLLEVTNLASYEEVQKTDRGHWAERIKEPLEQALDTLTQIGVLKNWEYTHAKGLALTDEEAREITSYGDFAKLYLHFVLADTVDDTERIQKKKKQREDAIKRKKEEKKKKQ